MDALFKRGMLQKQLSKKCDMSDTKLNRILNGSQAGSAKDYLEIANVLNWSLEYLYTGKESWDIDARKPVMDIANLLEGECIELQNQALKAVQFTKDTYNLKP